MKDTGFGSLAANATALWKPIALVVAVVTWAFAKSSYTFGFSTKLAFSIFLLRVYWPEILFAVLAALLTAAASWRMGWVGNRWRGAFNAWWRKGALTLPQINGRDKLLGGALLVGTLVVVLPALFHQIKLVFGSEQVFVGVRLMNWFGDDLHRIAAKQISDGEYPLAVRTLEVQAAELKGVTEGRTAAKMLQWLIAYSKETRATLSEIEVRVQKVGLTRSDLLMQGTLRAMLPSGPIGTSAASPPYGIGQLADYNRALRRVKQSCDAGVEATLTARDIGQAASALGFARTPELLFGRGGETETRRKVLCDITTSMTTEELEAAHRAAFSVSQLPHRLDWRTPLEMDAISTSGATVARAFVKALESPLVAVLGVPPFSAKLVGKPDGAPTLESAETEIKGFESKDVFLAPVAKLDETDERSLVAVKYLPSQRLKLEVIQAQVIQNAAGPVLVVCSSADKPNVSQSIAYAYDSSGTIKVTVREPCEDANFAGQKVAPGVGLIVAMTGYISKLDAGRLKFDSGVDVAKIRSFMCDVVTKGTKKERLKDDGVAMHLCPMHALAVGLPDAVNQSRSSEAPTEELAFDEEAESDASLVSRESSKREADGGRKRRPRQQ